MRQLLEGEVKVKAHPLLTCALRQIQAKRFVSHIMP